jgi:DNA-binding transcriptional regulator YhcF (GntR family)
LNISIDRQSKTSIQEQVKLEIAQRIRSGLLEEDYALPSVRQLSQCLDISLVTVHRIYKSLEKDGLIKTIRGKGTFVKFSNLLRNDTPQANNASLDPYNWHLSIPDYLPRASFWSQSSVRLPPEFLDMATASIHHFYFRLPCCKLPYNKPYNSILNPSGAILHTKVIINF